MSYWSKERERDVKKALAEKEECLRAMAAQQARYEHSDPFINIFGGAGISAQAYAQKILKQEHKPEHVGQLLWKGAPLPAAWRGAEYDVCQRTLVGVDHPHWHLEFGSKWTSERIHVYLDAEKVTGEEAHRLSQTFMEAINQRRMG